MTITFNSKAFAIDRETPDIVTYAGPLHTLTQQDTCELKRIYPKRSATFAGVAKPTLRFTRAVETDAVTGRTDPLIANVSLSIPVGTTATDIDDMLADVASAVASSVMADLCKKLKINAG